MPVTVTARSAIPRISHLRYTFDSAAQAEAHVRAVNGKQLLYYPASPLEVRGGDRVELGVSVGACEQLVSSVARVLGRDDAARGIWLELFSAGLCGELRTAANAPPRQWRRIPDDCLLRLDAAGCVSVAKAADVSLGGLRLKCLATALPVGTEITLRRFDAVTPMRARVVWMRDGEAGLCFVRSDSGTRAGAGNLFDEGMRRWNAAPDLHHPAACRCDSGGPVLEPLAPRLSVNATDVR